MVNFWFLAGCVTLDGGKFVWKENAEGIVLRLRKRAVFEHAGRAFLSYPGICKRSQSVLRFREPNGTNLTRNGVHELDLRSITRAEVVFFINTYLFLVNIVLRGFPLYFKPGWATYFRGDQAGDEGILDDRGALLLQLMLNRIDSVSPVITSHRDCDSPNCCNYPVVTGDSSDYIIVEDAQRRFGPALCEKMRKRCRCCTCERVGHEAPSCRCCIFADRCHREQFSHLGIASVEDFDSDDDGDFPDLNVFENFSAESDDGFESADQNNNFL